MNQQVNDENCDSANPPSRKRVTSAAPTPSKTKEVTIDWNAVSDCALWTNPARSAIVFGAGLMALLTWVYIDRGSIEFRPFSFLAYSGLFMLSANFFGSIFIPNFKPFSLFSSGRLRSMSRKVEGVLISLAPSLNRILSGANPILTLQSSLAMWAVISLNAMMRCSTMCLLAHFAFFSLPLLYKRFEDDIMANVNRGVRQAGDVWENIELDRKYKLGIVGVNLGAVWWVCPIHTKITSLFVSCIIFKCFMKPAEISKLMQFAAPVGDTVSKKARRISGVVRHLCSPTKS